MVIYRSPELSSAEDTCKLVDSSGMEVKEGGIYPNWERVVPDSYLVERRLSYDALRLAIVSLKPIYKGCANRIKLSFTSAICTVSSEAEDCKLVARVEIPCQSIFNEPLKSDGACEAWERVGMFDVDGDYMLDFIPLLKRGCPTTIVIRHRESSRPIELYYATGEDSASDGWECLSGIVMPMALK
jgi:hypothetical protein